MQALFRPLSRPMPVRPCIEVSSFEIGKLFVQPLQVPIAIWNYHSRFYRATLRRARLCYSMSSVCPFVRPSV